MICWIIMTAIDTLNIILTSISIVVTIVSIFLSIWASSSAKKAKQYKEEVLEFRDVLNLEGLLSGFLTESKYFLDKTRDNNWYKGVDVTSIISPFKQVLFSFGNSYHLISNYTTIRDKVHELNEIVQNYDKASSFQRKRANSLIMEIADILQQELHNNKVKIIKQ